MIQNDLVTQLQLLIKTSAPPLLEVEQQQLELPQLVPGQKVPAHVVANLPNGRFQVLIADKMLDMNLPKNTQPGDTVDLVFVTTKPRLTFVLASDLGNITNSTNAANAASAKPQVSLSETARFLGGLLEKTAQPISENNTKKMATAVASTTPLLAGAPAKTLDFAQALRGALTQSGLFYESHQAQWVTGQRPLTDLLREPQGRLSPAAANLPQMLQSGTLSQPPLTSTAGAPAQMPLQQQVPNLQQSNGGIPLNKPPSDMLRHELPANQSGAPPQPAMAGASNAQAAPELRPALSYPHNSNDAQFSKPLAADQIAHPDTLPLVRQQLEVLDSRQVVWQGQVWPGQTMDWQIEERPAREHGGEMAIPEWQTSLRLILPQLGEIAAKLSLHPQGIRIQIDASDPASAKLLEQQRIALQQGMKTSGLQLVEMKVHHETEG